MRVILTTLATEARKAEDAHPFLAKVLRSVLPQANPDFESRFAEVRLWWVEVADDGTPQRELGFGDKNEVLVACPIGENSGFWTDSAMKFEGGAYEEVDASAFDGYWSRYEAQWWSARAGRSDA